MPAAFPYSTHHKVNYVAKRPRDPCSYSGGRNIIYLCPPDFQRNIIYKNMEGVTMLEQFCAFLVDQGKAENTLSSYRQAVGDYMKWYEATFGEPMEQLYRICL